MVFTEQDPLDRVARALDEIDRTTAFTGAYGRPVNQVDVKQLFEAQYYLREAVAALAEELRAQRGQHSTSATPPAEESTASLPDEVPFVDGGTPPLGNPEDLRAHRRDLEERQRSRGQVGQFQVETKVSRVTPSAKEIEDRG
jgi:hypothetical protein